MSPCAICFEAHRCAICAATSDDHELCALCAATLARFTGAIPGGLVAPINRLDDNEYDHAWATVDEPAFGAKVAQLLDNEVQRRSLGRIGSAHIRASFQWTNAARQFGEVMETRMEAVA